MKDPFNEVKNPFWGFYWLVIYSYRNRLINRKEFMGYWGAIQSIESAINGIIRGKEDETVRH